MILFNHVLKMIQDEICNLEDILYQPNLEYQFLEDFMTHTRFSRVEDIMDIPLENLIIAYLTSQKNAISFETIYDFFQNTELEDAFNGDTIDLIVKLSNLRKKENMSISDSIAMELTIKVLENISVDYKALSEILLDNIDAYASANGFWVVLPEICEQYQKSMVFFNKINEKEGIKIPKKYSERATKRQIHASFNMDVLKKRLLEIQTYYQLVEKEQKQREKNIKRQIVNYRELEKCLSKVSFGELEKNLKKVLLIEKEEIKREILKYMNQLLEQEYKVLSQEYEELSRVKKIEYQDLLVQYQYSYVNLNPVQKRIVSSFSAVDLREILDNLKELHLSEEGLLFVLENSTKEIVLQIQNLIKRGVLSSCFVKENLDIYGELYPRLNQNLESIQKMDLNICLFGKNPYLLLLDPSLLEKNLNVLREYSFITEFKNSENISFLKLENLSNIIDCWLELGYEQELEECFDILNKDFRRIRRIRILKSLNVPVEGVKELLKVLDSNRFIIGDAELENYVWNVVPYRSSDFLKEENSFQEGIDFSGLEKFDYTARTYKIGNLIFSKRRVQKNFSKLVNFDVEEDKIWNACICGAILNEQEWEELYNQIYGMKKEI